MKPSALGLLLFASFVLPSTLFCQSPQVPKHDAGAQRIALATLEVQRIKDLVEHGAVPPIRLEQAEQDLADAQDDAILGREQAAGSTEAGDESEGDRIAAAQRRVDRQKGRIERNKELAAAGILASSDVSSLELELSRRELDLYWAQSRAQFAEQEAESARLKSMISAQEQASGDEELTENGMEHYEGVAAFDEDRDLKPLAIAFEAEFDRALPISADGETELHRALGFDHRGRIDVAVNPNDADGVWLRQYLRSRKIPYYAFTHAIPGKATAAHIHIGPGSTALAHPD